MKKYCKIKMEGKSGEIQKCVKAENKKLAESKLKNVEGKLVQFDWKRNNMEKKKQGLGLAITIINGNVESKMKSKGINKFETIGLLVFQILNIFEDIKKQTIKKERWLNKL